MNPLKILHLEDLPPDAELVERELKKSGIEFDKIIVDNRADFIKALQEFGPDIILSDHSLPSFNSIDAIKIVKEERINAPFILITSTISEEFAVEIMKEGAYDYILKDRLQRLPKAILNAMEKFRIEKERKSYLNKVIASEAMLKTLNESLEKKVTERTIQLEKANQELESFGYSVSHDLKTPLTVIATSASILEERCKNEPNEQELKHILKIKNNARMMGTLIDDLLTLSHFSRTYSFTKENVNMTKLVEEVIELVGPIYKSNNHKIQLNTLEDVECNPGLIKQVWVNLISNALKYSRDKANPVIEIDSTTVNREIVYSVTDNGAGFDMEDADKLFGVFQRLHSGTGFEGTGVGLAIVQRIITNHNGKVWAEGKTGIGATFYFSLPTAKPTT